MTPDVHTFSGDDLGEKQMPSNPVTWKAHKTGREAAPGLARPGVGRVGKTGLSRGRARRGLDRAPGGGGGCARIGGYARGRRAPCGRGAGAGAAIAGPDG